MLNKILNDKAREFYNDTINELFTLCPSTMTRKIPAANVQQGFVLKTAKDLSTLDSEFLSAGSYEDTASESLIKLGYKVVEIDPSINVDLHTYHMQNMDKKFDTIISTSVIEHVEDDELFIDDICKMLKKGGYGILTCDFNNSYKKGDGKPGVDYRLYTKYDLLERLRIVLLLNDCDIYGDYDYESVPDFLYEGCYYSFASYVIKKNN